MVELLNHFFITSDGGVSLIAGSYRWGLVLLSLFVAMFSSTMAMYTVNLARNAERGMPRQIARGIGAISLGGGIWTMHFIGMMAFELCSPVSYSSTVTLLSSIPGLASAWLAMWILSRRDPGQAQIIVAGTLVGVGIGAMHYSGMQAMQFSGVLRYDPYGFGLSIVVAVALAIFSLWLRYGLSRYAGMLSASTRLVISGCVLGLAISCMHYVAMRAARFVGDTQTADNLITINTTFLAFALSTFTVTVTVLVAALTSLMSTRTLNRKLEDGEARLRSIIETAVDGIITIDCRGLVQSFSPSAERLFGWKSAEVVGRNINMLMPEPDKSRHDGYLDNYLRSGDPKVIGTGREIMGRRKDGSLMPMRLAVGRVNLPDGLIFVGFVSDITERHKLEASLRETAERAERAAAAKGTFLANMSHEIRTPMNSIIGFTELLLKGQDLTETQRSHLSIVRNSSRSLLVLLNDILDTTRLEKGGVSLESIDFSFKELVLQVDKSLRLAAQKKNLEFIVDYPEDMPEYFQGDPLRIQQVLTNLLGNAIKFTERGHVRMVMSYEDGMVHARVSDSGIGMSPEHVAKVFSPFTQADASISRRFGGTGLGTTIALQLIELMKGAIDVESTLGVGSVFHARLPLRVGSRPLAGKVDISRFMLPSLNILVADDVPQNLKLATLMLEEVGHRVTTAANGAQAVDRFKEGYFDLVLMDVHMPQVNGLDAARRIRSFESEMPSRSSVPIIALTASVMAEDQRTARAAGMDGFAVKPLDSSQLMTEILRVMRRGRHASVAAAQPGPGPSSVLINWKAGAALWGSESRLADAISRFLDDVRERYPLPDAAQTDVDWNIVQYNLHSIRGAAGNLAMSMVHDLAARLENMVRDGKAEEARLRFAELQELLIAVARELLGHALPFVSETQARPELAPAEFLQALQSLLECLDRSELPDDIAQTVCDTLEKNDPVYAKVLKAAIDSFEFSKAQTLLRQIIAHNTANTQA
ncbi:MHYT domain-containing protein [Bordetella sp. FB-8]|uniref:MHYT domain-containing protein n=1 Tax=Bordetella sp. FB-8 TaxID=1159870 RepID=UPI0003799214|nr:MHYT domain-containing protein [Bordetella sp. FB-8]